MKCFIYNFRIWFNHFDPFKLNILYITYKYDTITYKIFKILTSTDNYLHKDCSVAINLGGEGNLGLH